MMPTTELPPAPEGMSWDRDETGTFRLSGSPLRAYIFKVRNRELSLKWIWKIHRTEDDYLHGYGGSAHAAATDLLRNLSGIREKKCNEDCRPQK